MCSSCCARVFIFVIDALVIGAPLGIIIRSTPVQHLLCREIQSFCCQMFLTDFLDKPLHSIGQATAFRTYGSIKSTNCFVERWYLRRRLPYIMQGAGAYSTARFNLRRRRDWKGLGVDDDEHAEDSLYNTCIVCVCVCESDRHDFQSWCLFLWNRSTDFDRPLVAMELMMEARFTGHH